ncbi:MAG: TlpA family protein disulfide reductase [Methylococcaceae bacterium]|nr:TlpA family protein disulfide reductase [Methylococcaceae bacterium]
MKVTKRILITILLFSVIALAVNFKKSVPNVTFTTLKGQVLSLDALHGKTVVVTFWVTDCASCLKEIPLWLDLYSRYHAQGLEIIGVSMYYDPPNQVIEFLKQYTLPYLMTLDISASFAKAFGGVNVTPTTFLLNQKGEIVWQKVGLFELAELESIMQNLLKEK